MPSKEDHPNEKGPKPSRNIRPVAAASLATVLGLSLIALLRSGEEEPSIEKLTADFAKRVNESLFGVINPNHLAEYSEASRVASELRERAVWEQENPIGKSFLVGRGDSIFDEGKLRDLIGDQSLTIQNLRSVKERNADGSKISDKALMALFIARQYPQAMCLPGGVNNHGEDCRSEAVHQRADLRGAIFNPEVINAIRAGDQNSQRAALRSYIAEEFFPGMVAVHLLRGLFKESSPTPYGNSFSSEELELLGSYGNNDHELRKKQIEVIKGNPVLMRDFKELAGSVKDDVLDKYAKELQEFDLSKVILHYAEQHVQRSRHNHNNPGNSPHGHQAKQFHNPQRDHENNHGRN